jgi:hypothetical protein
MLVETFRLNRIISISYTIPTIYCCRQIDINSTAVPIGLHLPFCCCSYGDIIWVEVPELFVNCYRPLLTWRQDVNKFVHHHTCSVFLIPSVMEYKCLDFISNKIFIILHTPKSSLSKIHSYRAAHNCTRYPFSQIIKLLTLL